MGARVEPLHARPRAPQAMAALFADGWPARIEADRESELYLGRVREAFAQHEQGVEPDTLGIMAAQVHPARRGRGLAGELLAALRRTAEERGLTRVVAPVRPTLKARYPLIPVERFATWVREDGAPLDPWLRTHWRLGARTVAVAPASQTMTGTVAQWEGWTGTALPGSGTPRCAGRRDRRRRPRRRIP